MIRRLQLLEPESRLSARHLATLGGRIRDGLLRDNRVLPPILAVLALLVFTWFVAVVLVGSSGEKERQQVSNQPPLSQGGDDPSLAQGRDDSNSGAPGTPSPGVEDRDVDSFARFKSKDPFRDLISTAGETTTTRASDGGGRNNGREDSDGGSRNGDSRSDRGRQDFLDQSFSGGSGSRTDGGNGGIGTSADRGGAGQGGGVGQGGNGGLFNSGGDLAP